MSDNYGINTTQSQSLIAGGLNPNDPSQTIGDMMVSNQQKQAEQAALVQQAVEKAKQAKMVTGVDEEGGLEAEKGLVPKAQALTDLKAAAASSNLDDDQKAQILQDAKDNWPEVVSQDAIHRLVTALHVSKPGRLGEGAAFEADGSQMDENGKPYPKGSMIQEIEDTEGGHSYVRSNSPPSVQTAGDKSGAADQKRKTQLVTLIATQLKAARGNWLSQGLYRCSTESQRLHSTPNLTKQDLKQIAIGLAAVFTGGVPSEDEVLKTEYSTKLSDILGTLGSWTGIIKGLPLDDIRTKLGGIIDGLNDELVRRFTGLMDFYAQGFQDVVEGDPTWWEQTRQKALDAAEHKESPSAAVQSTVGHNLMPIGSGVPRPEVGAAQSAPAPVAASSNDPMGIL